MSGGGSAGFVGFGCVTGDGRWVVGDGFAGFGLWEMGGRGRMSLWRFLEEVNGMEGDGNGASSFP